MLLELGKQFGESSLQCSLEVFLLLVHSELVVGSGDVLTLWAFPLLDCVPGKWGPPKKPVAPEWVKLDLY